MEEQEPLKAFAVAVCGHDAAAARRALGSPHVRAHVNDPMFAFGQRAVHLAANHLELLDVLLEAGGDLSLLSDWANGPYSVLDNADEQHARAVIARGAVLTANVAARLGWFDQLRGLVDAQPSRVHERGGDGQQPLHAARTIEIARYLLDRGAGIDTPCIDHRSTPAQYALADRTDVCRFLLERGARPDIFMAAWIGDRPLAERLIAEDPACLAARVNQDGYAPVPPFNIYCWTLGFLVSPHEVAQQRGHQALLDLFVERSPLPMRFLVAATSGDEPAARAALARDPDVVRSLGPGDHSQLAQTIFHGRFDAARLMLALGFDPMAGGTDGGTALHCACWVGEVDLVERILATGRVPIESRDPTHQSTPLGWTAFGSVHRRARGGNYAAVIDRLAAAGADLRAAGNGAGQTLIGMAEGNADVQAALRRHGAT